MKTIIQLTLVLCLCAIPLACSPMEQREFGETFPELSPTTRAVERIEQLSDTVRDAATQAQAIGIPGAGLVALAASVLGTVLRVYNERRRGTIPLKSAVEQIVQSVETAFPEKSDMQKAMMASVQDRATRRIVSRIKGD